MMSTSTGSTDLVEGNAVPLDNYTDAQLRTILRAGPVPAHVMRGASLADKIRILEIAAGEPYLAPEERKSAATQAAKLRRLARLRSTKGRVRV